MIYDSANVMEEEEEEEEDASAAGDFVFVNAFLGF